MTIHTLCYNESYLLPQFVKFYRERFNNCEIIVFDNESTDDSVSIAKKLDCKVIPYTTNNKLSDKKYLEIKNSCWKESKTDWNIIVDIDEFCDINEDDLLLEEKNKTSHIKFIGYEMVNINNGLPNDLTTEVIYGMREVYYDKTTVINKKYVRETNYNPGCHNLNLIGNLTNQEKNYNLYHYKFLSENYIINKHRIYRERLSDDNIKNNFGSHYYTSEEDLKTLFKQKQKQSVIIN
jgi:glycosyltransferase involved in cell wall biosynthesis